RPDESGSSERDEPAGVAASATGESGEHAEDSDYAAVVCRRAADPGESDRARDTPRLAGSAAVYLSHRTRAGAGENPFEAGLSVLDDLGCGGENSGDEVSG